MAKEQASFFTVIVTGQVEFAEVRPTRDARRAPPLGARRGDFSECHPRGATRAPLDDAFPDPDASRLPFFPLVVADSRV